MIKTIYCNRCSVNYTIHYNPHTFLYQCPQCNSPFQHDVNSKLRKMIRKQRAIFFSQFTTRIVQRRLMKRCIRIGKELRVTPGFKCLSGNLIVGDHVKLNNSYIDATALVTIGDYTFLGRDVQVLTASHEITKFRLDRQAAIISKPINIGSGVFIASRAIILGGTTIGDNSVIGSGAVVTADIPHNVLAAGNPARVKRQLPKS